jgi:hypothetical protein
MRQGAGDYGLTPIVFSSNLALDMDVFRESVDGERIPSQNDGCNYTSFRKEPHSWVRIVAALAARGQASSEIAAPIVSPEPASRPRGAADGERTCGRGRGDACYSALLPAADVSARFHVRQRGPISDIVP